MDLQTDTRDDYSEEVTKNAGFVVDIVGSPEISEVHNSSNEGFVIDTTGISATSEVQNISDEGSSFVRDLFQDCTFSVTCKKLTEGKNSKNIVVKEILQDLGFNDDGTLIKKRPKRKITLLNATEKREVSKVLEKSIIMPEFEKLHVVPPLEVSVKKSRELRKKERALTKGSKWYGLPATELTEEVKKDLEILQMRSVLDPKHFYKKNDLKVLPKYFQIGKVMDSTLDFYNNRVPKKQRKKTLVDELLADAEFNKYNKRKYKEIIEDKQRTHYKAWRQAKRLKKKK